MRRRSSGRRAWSPCRPGHVRAGVPNRNWFPVVSETEFGALIFHPRGQLALTAPYAVNSGGREIASGKAFRSRALAPSRTSALTISRKLLGGSHGFQLHTVSRL